VCAEHPFGGLWNIEIDVGAWPYIRLHKYRMIGMQMGDEDASRLIFEIRGFAEIQQYLVIDWDPRVPRMLGRRWPDVVSRA